MKKLLLFFFLIGLSCECAQAQNNIDISNYRFFDGECYLASNPKNPKHLVAAWIHALITGKTSIATRSSFDGGLTWTPLTLLPHLHANFSSPDPTMYFGKDSCVYLAYIDLSGLSNSDSGYIMVTRSVNGGVTWNTPVKAIAWNAQPNLPIDRPWIAADASNGPYAGRVYLTSQSAYFTPQPHHPWFTYSTDSGATWAPVKRLDDSIPSGTITDATAFPTVAANGTLYAVYFSYYVSYSPYARMVMVKSYDGGNTFTTHAIINYTAADAVPASDTLTKDGICLSSNPADTNNLIVIGTSNHFGEPDIVAYNTHDAGNTWSGPTRLNDDQSGAYDTIHDLTWGGFSANGTYAAVWRDRRNTGQGDTVPFQIYGTTSLNGGNSFARNFRVSDSLSPFINYVHGVDFLGCEVNDSSVYALWCDMRRGNPEIFFNASQLNTILTVSSITNNPDITVDAFPNPFHDETTVIIHSTQSLPQARLLVYSVDGKQVGDLPVTVNTSTKLKFSSLAAGTYLWSVMQNGKKLAEGKWLVQ